MKSKILGSILCALVVYLPISRAFAQSGVYLESGSSQSNGIVWGNTNNSNASDQQSGAGTTANTAVQGATAPTGANNKALATSPFVGSGVSHQEKYSVKPNSATINAGDNAKASIEYAADAAGYGRIWNATVDMGAYEYQFPRTITITAQDTGKTEGEADPAQLAYTLSGDPLLPGDSLSVQLTRLANEAVGAYAIDTTDVGILRPGASLSVRYLYNVAFIKGTFTIKAKGTTAVAKNGLSATLYPTVTSGTLYVSSEQAGPVKVEVYGLNGQLLKSQTYGGGTFDIDLSSVPKGMLFVKLSSGGKSASIQVVKQ